MQPRNRIVLVATALAVVSMIIVSTGPSQGQSASQPANKMAVSGSALELMSTSITGGQQSENVTLLTGTIKTSSPTDLIISLTAECALWTDTIVVGNSDSQSVAQVVAWVELDGKAIPVAAGDTGAGAGRVVLCNRLFEMQTQNFPPEDQNATIKTFDHTRQANAFNWITLNVGSGTHSFVVKAEMDLSVSGMGNAQAAIGKRTLVVDPTMLAQDATI
ncbi:MAG: hypothetical protein ACYDCK_13765 [Thermoplasmatota archaeon]